VARGDLDPQHYRPDGEPQRWAEVYRLAVNPGVHWFWGGYLQTRRAPGSYWTARAVAGRIEDDDAELAAFERRATAGG
jgi:hypothetical protein